MADRIVRSCAKHIDLEVSDNASTSGTFQMSEAAGGLLHCVLGNGTLTFYSLPDIKSSTQFLLRDKFNANVTLTVAEGHCYPLPEELFAAKRVRIVLSSGTGTLQLLFKS